MTKPCVPQPLTPVAQTSFCIFTPLSSIGQATDELLLWLLIPSQFSHTHSLSFPLSLPFSSLSHTHTHTTSSRCLQKCPDPISAAHHGGLPHHPRTKFQHTPTPFPSPLFPISSPAPTGQETWEAWGGKAETLNASVPTGSPSPRPRPRRVARPLPPLFTCQQVPNFLREGVGRGGGAGVGHVRERGACGEKTCAERGTEVAAAT